MFRMFVYEEKHQGEIAAILNKEQIKTDLGRRWTAGSVQQVLTNEKYIGNNVFNRASAKLTNKRIANPPEMWVRAIGAFPAIVDPALPLFVRAGRFLHQRRARHRGQVRSGLSPGGRWIRTSGSGERGQGFEPRSVACEG